MTEKVRVENGVVENSRALFADALATMILKNQDYSGSNDGIKSMKNFRLAEEVVGIKMTQGILVRITDKIARIGNLLRTNAFVKDETIHDTIQDAINYLAILNYAIMIEDLERQGKMKCVDLEPSIE